MKSRFTHIPARDDGKVFRLVAFAFLALLSIACVFCPMFLPQLESADERILLAIKIVSTLSTAFFSFMTAYSICLLAHPADAFIICKSGYFDFITVPGDSIFLPWSDVDNAKLFGTRKAPVLGVYLADPEKLLTEIDEDIAEELRSNIEMGLPPLMYRGSEIAPELKSVLTLFMKRIAVGGIQVGADAEDEDEDDYTLPVIEDEDDD